MMLLILDLFCLIELTFLLEQKTVSENKINFD